MTPTKAQLAALRAMVEHGQLRYLGFGDWGINYLRALADTRTLRECEDRGWVAVTMADPDRRLPVFRKRYDLTDAGRRAGAARRKPNGGAR